MSEMTPEEETIEVYSEPFLEDVPRQEHGVQDDGLEDEDA